MSFEDHFEMKTMSASDQNSNMAFLRNEFLKIVEDFLTMRFTEMTLIHDQTRIFPENEINY